MLEIEQKYKNVDHAQLEATLKNRIGSWLVREEVDHYFNAPDRDFAQTHEAFRLRRVSQENFLTYKGPRIDTEVKIRPELEFAIQEGDQAAEDMTQLLKYLGYRSVAVVRKSRRMGSFEEQGFRVSICLDQVDELGSFAEIEIIASEADTPNARAVLLEIAKTLDLNDVEPRSYLRMLLASEEA